MLEGIHRVLRARATVGVVVGVLVAALVIGLREAGLLEAAELLVYDWMVRMQPADKRPDGRVVVLGVTETDIQTLGHWPLTDAMMAFVLERTAALGPRAIGVDIYRDLPVPPGREVLHQVLARHPEIVMAMTFSQDGFSGVPAPASMVGAERVGFNDVLPDRDGTVRRGLLFLGSGDGLAYSLPLRLTLRYLRHEGIEPAPDPGEASHLNLNGTTLPPVRRDDGPYVGIDARGYQIMLDYSTSGASIPTYSLTELLNGQVGREAIKDRVVLLGAMAESVPDLFPTPRSRGTGTEGRGVFGVVLHAAITDQLLRAALDGQPPVRSFPEAMERAWIVLWAAAGGGMGIASRSLSRSLVLTGLGLVVMGGLATAAFLGRWWIPLVPPAVAFIASGGLTTAWLVSQEKRERAQLMQLFSRHVSADVAETIWEQREQFVNRGRLVPREVTATVLFVDFQGYTGVSERLEGAKLLDWINTYMDAMARQVMAHGGFVDDYFGDALKADFGVPLFRSDENGIREDALHAVACALAMVRELRALNRQNLVEGRLPAGVRIGICTGPVVAGSQGSADRLKYTVLGDTVNVAFRLQTFDKQAWVPEDAEAPNRILLSDSTARHVAGRYPLEQVGEMMLAGKTTRVTVYRLRGESQPADAASAEVLS